MVQNELEKTVKSVPVCPTDCKPISYNIDHVDAAISVFDG